MKTLRDCAQFLEEKDVTYDFAFPVDFGYEIEKRTGLWPSGVVWVYDKYAKIFGRPFPLTTHARIALFKANIFPKHPIK